MKSKKRSNNGMKDRSNDGTLGERYGCSLHLPRSVAPSEEAVERLTRTVEAEVADALGSVEVVQSRDPQTGEPMWIGVVWLRCGDNEGREARLQVLRAVHETYPGEWFGRLVVEVRTAREL